MLSSYYIFASFSLCYLDCSMLLCLHMYDCDCDGAALEILKNKKFQWPQGCLNCEPLTCNRKCCNYRCSPPEVFLGKGVLKICSNFIGEHSCRNVVSMLQSNFIEITLRHGCSPVNLLHIFTTPFPKNTSGGLLHHLPNPLTWWSSGLANYITCKRFAVQVLL